ncbi:MAG: hypothetical protein VYB73_04545 [Verrucomicrobiota bacterium]|nr:hypothetical protein [Verrucomicrobiota bacterium]
MKSVALGAEDSKSVFIFDWVVRAKRPFWIAAFVFLSLIAHLFCFYLFSVVYPPQKRELLNALEVTVLDSSDSEARSFLKQIDDRFIALDQEITAGVLGQDLSDTAVRFEPFFENHFSEFKEIPTLGNYNEGSFFPSGSLYLPPPTGRKIKPYNELRIDKIGPVVTFLWDKEIRATVIPFQWHNDTNANIPNGIDSFNIHIGVDRFGRVVHSLPEKSAGKEVDEAIIRALRSMRFSSASAEEITWAMVTITW